MRERLIWDRRLKSFVPAHEYYAARMSEAISSLPSPMLVRDIEPYRSTVTGETITGRRQHRDHLKAHDCVELGNDILPSKPLPMPSVGADIQRAIEQGPSPEMKPALERARKAT